MVQELDDVILFKIYLKGDLNSGFQKLQRETVQLLNELKAENSLVEYELIDPSDNDDEQLTRDIFEQLRFKGFRTYSS